MIFNFGQEILTVKVFIIDDALAFLRDLFKRATYLLPKLACDYLLERILGLYFFIKKSESYVLEVGDRLYLIIEYYLFSHYLY